MKTVVFWNVTPFSLKILGGTCCLHNQGDDYSSAYTYRLSSAQITNYEAPHCVIFSILLLFVQLQSFLVTNDHVSDIQPFIRGISIIIMTGIKRAESEAGASHFRAHKLRMRGTLPPRSLYVSWRVFTPARRSTSKPLGTNSTNIKTELFLNFIKNLLFENKFK